MPSGASIVPTRTTTSNFPFFTSPAGAVDLVAAPTPVLSDFEVFPIITAPPTPSCSGLNVVVVDLSTTLTIPDYHRFYDTPIKSFQPVYFSLDDGSLVTPIFISDVKIANSALAIFAAMSTFFLLTAFASAGYLHRSVVKRKGLFYMLLISQCLGLISTIPMLVSYFDQSTNCTVVGLISRVASVLSYSLLMTGILGVKAYKCLDNSRIVLLVLTTLRITMITLVILDLARFRGDRRLSGSCFSTSEEKMFPFVIIVQFAELLFICVCFVVAVWRTSRSPIGQGRLSIHLSVDHKEITECKEADGDGAQTRRGWWDYVPEPPKSQEHTRSTLPKRSNSSVHDGIIHTIRNKLHEFLQDDAVLASPSSKPPPLCNELPGLRPPRTSSVSFASGPAGGHERMSSRGIPRTRQDPSPSRPSSVISRVSKYIPRMLLFRRVIRDELLYTAFLTVVYLLVAVPMLVGMRAKLILGPDGWLVAHWIIVSIFTMHSFSRVVRRHEREAILQHPSAWDPMYRAELEASRAFRQRDVRRPFSPISTLSRRPLPRNDTGDNPFRDSRSNRNTLPSGTYSFPPVATRDAPSPYASQAWRSFLDVPVSPPISDDISPAPTPIGRVDNQMNWDTVVVLPSPMATNVSSPSSEGGFPDTPITDIRSFVDLDVTDTEQSSPSLQSHYSFPHSFDSRTLWGPTNGER